MSWLATSPYGPLQSASWECHDCPASSGASRLRSDADALRAAARTHVEVTGHTAEFTRGTTETLYAMATGAAGGGQQ